MLTKKMERLLKRRNIKFTYCTYADGGDCIELDFYTPEGGEECPSFDAANDSGFAYSLSRYAEYYDPDEEATYWIGEDGHGKNGAPYRISDIIKDKEWVEKFLLRLSRAVDALAMKEYAAA